MSWRRVVTSPEYLLANCHYITGGCTVFVIAETEMERIALRLCVFTSFPNPVRHIYFLSDAALDLL